MNTVIVTQGVRGYVDSDGTAWLNVEDTARGLGFTEIKDGVEYVKWRRVNNYLKDFGFSTQVAKDDFIPENIFYRLAMKAKNDFAEAFQALVVDEILPAIRKTGYYDKSPVEPQKSLSPYIEDILDTAALIQKGFKVKSETALDTAISLVEKNNHINIESVRRLIPKSVMVPAIEYIETPA